MGASTANALGNSFVRFGQSLSGQPQQPTNAPPVNQQVSTFGQPMNNWPPQGQSDGISRPMGKGGVITYPGQSGQPQYGQPNRYSNTVGPWDNASIGTQNPFQRSGKGKGA